MPSAFLPAWGPATLFRLGTTPPETFPVSCSFTGPACRLTFGRELVCELRPHGPELEGKWRFGLHQPLALPAGAAATVRHELRLFVYKPAGARVTVQLKAAGTTQALLLREEAVSEGEEFLALLAPLRLAHGGQAVWLEVQAQRPAGPGQVLVTVDALTLTLEPGA
ncbi:hypothetical protein [Hymenobacter ruricola]|uniref:Uncharacterized protein n=1 Tax=Hymenobacter ruricola TaxID=2791023 RepID=A0ABS0I9U2_9BACT|nr:hypothetical protein [Hymenobacter ruricola]MBF9223453.1 hypothetical protein [Hymenobacter ruricola]